ncbi:UDP-N-acetylglucosamine 2-epimerase (hydrolyzing) [Mucilaginibacter mali]|uniref:UDP-N-acetylglucosamine 2-epimerase (Hydrolyzing) n=1 Tax=Mucilaginibacter mali TaxID=2740462 RepID=A0A7D4TWE0_9SPHI|nr:UDP-N-acetylglucosamine 2-epimerase [Mucilaginibacter mali]QKJ29397.1 UDP-N-acetylglucosamine 2-epimerase (hydrolyzing) [Mucilaginibacter mali]
MKVCIATATRAEYGLLKPLIDKILIEPGWTLQTLVTGAHLSPEFGLTYQQIERDGLKIDAKVEMLLSSDTAGGIVKSMGLGMIGYADAFKNLATDLLIILGDRYEMLAIASAALIYKIPIAHINGGEVTEGAYDDAIRHAITKMSHYHFTSTDEYRKRVIQLGEHAEHVFNVGALSIDNIKNIIPLSREQLERDLGIKFLKYNYQVTFHPTTLGDISSEKQFKELLSAINTQDESFFIFTKANADTDGRIINQMIDEYISMNPDKAASFTSLGTIRFLSVLKVCDAIVGNSSSGIVEAPSLGIATINIGSRQHGRIQAQSIINCSVNTTEIVNAFEQIKDSEFKLKTNLVISPYGNGNAAQEIVNAIRSIHVKKYSPKVFNNIAF